MQKRFFIFFIILLDQTSKFFALGVFPQIVSFNKGIAFGFFPSDWWLVINFTLIFFLSLLIKRKLPAVLIIGGGISNILDRLFRGAVIDFIDLKVIPIFNFADFFICFGVMILLFIEVNKHISASTE